jgi:natural product biosynthesis luciferase-like monooxygenase protein
MTINTINKATYPLSPTQEGMLFDRLVGQQAGVHIEQIHCTLHEALDVDAFHEAWLRFVSRHDVLRTTFRWEGLDEPLQDVHSEITIPLEQHDWRHLSGSEQQAGVQTYLRMDREKGFDLTQPPLIRLALFRLGETHYQLVWTFYHGLLDGRAFPLALQEVFDLYETSLRGGIPTTEERVPYRRFIEWTRQQDWAGAEVFWRQKLNGFSAPTPILHALAPNAVPEDVAIYGEQERELSAALTRDLKTFADQNNLTLNTLFQGAWALLLSCYSGEEEVVFGSIRACRHSSIPQAETMLGVFINTLPLRVEIPLEKPLLTWLREIREQQLELRQYEHTPLVKVQQWSDVGAGTPLFESILIYDNSLLGPTLQEQGGRWSQRNFVLHDQTNYPLTIRAHYYGSEASRFLLNIHYYRDRFDNETVQRMLGHLETVLGNMVKAADQKLSSLGILSVSERHQLLVTWNDTQADYAKEKCIHQLFEEQAGKTADSIAVVFQSQKLTYSELNARANQLARYLQKLGVGPEQKVGICTERSLDMVVAILAVLKAGGAYIPLDPTYPKDRLEFMLKDSALSVLLSHSHLVHQFPDYQGELVLLDRDWPGIANARNENLGVEVSPQNLAYLIYTSGSTGKPKGVMVEHRNVVNFFAGMDERIEHKVGDVWLAVTSLSFDISVLELLWTLTRGFKVVLYVDETHARSSAKPIDFSLFYFASDEGNSEKDKYRLLMEGAKFADEHGFSAVWTPERHFHAFGGLYPNPSVVSAAIAAVTKNIKIRAGSIVLPLQDPIRIAEEWSVVDNLSNGRVGISFASGWQPNDFVLAPENYTQRRELLYTGVETVQKLWRGGSVSRPDGNQELVEVSILPKPVQLELPVWITAAGAPETFKKAGEIGANLLTHLLGQTVEELAEKLSIYRQAWREHGHSPGGAHVTLMLHTLVGTDEDQVRETVRQPMKDYLNSSLSLVKKAAWYWPTTANATEKSPNEFDEAFNSFSDEEKDDLLEHAFRRYYETSGLFGTPESCLKLVETLKQIGVDEIACLIDFGVASDKVLESLQPLHQLRELSNQDALSSREVYPIPRLVKEHSVSHFQCTPSMATMLTLNDDNHAAIEALKHVLIGGEALPSALVARLRELTPAKIQNMYGPTETTIWSATYLVTNASGTIPIGRPIANTQIYIVDHNLNPVPIGVTGELLIGGDGVVRGYLNRDELTRERFIPDPFSSDPRARLYRTGDLARYQLDGNIEFLGRADHQVKIRGYRIELGEIEALLNDHPAVQEAVVIAREDSSGDKRLVAYLVSAGETPPAREFRERLQEKLPDYMIPSNFVFLRELPLTPNAKVDRKSLPAPDKVEAKTARTYEPPGNDFERSIAAIWKEVLNINSVGRQDNFFDMGGHSLHVVRVHSRLRNVISQQLSMTDLFRFPTIRSLAEHLSNGTEKSQALDTSRDRVNSRKEALGRRRQMRNKTLLTTHHEDKMQ